MNDFVLLLIVVLGAILSALVVGVGVGISRAVHRVEAYEKDTGKNIDLGQGNLVAKYRELVGLSFETQRHSELVESVADELVRKVKAAGYLDDAADSVFEREKTSLESSDASGVQRVRSRRGAALR